MTVGSIYNMHVEECFFFFLVQLGRHCNEGVGFSIGCRLQQLVCRRKWNADSVNTITLYWQKRETEGIPQQNTPKQVFIFFYMPPLLFHFLLLLKLGKRGHWLLLPLFSAFKNVCNASQESCLVDFGLG